MALNRIYKVVWSKTKGCYVVVSELAKRVGRNKAKAIVISSAAMAMAVIPVVTSTVGAAPNQAGTGPDNSVVWGQDTKVEKNNGVAIGKGAKSTEDSAIALGFQSKSSGNWSVAIGLQTNATNKQAVAVGSKSQATGENSIAIGNAANASNESSVALGSSTQSTNKYTTAVGGTAFATQEGATALGYGARATAKNTIAIGNSTKAEQEGVLALGAQAYAKAADTIAIGNSATAKQVGDIIIGKDAKSRDQGGGRSVAIGFKAMAGSNRNSHETNDASTGKRGDDGSVAIGTNAYTGLNKNNTAVNSSVALGAGAGVGYRSVGTDGTPLGVGTDADDNATVLVKAFGGTTGNLDYFKNTGKANAEGFFSFQNVDINEGTALGRNTRAMGDQSVAIGAQSVAGMGSIVIGGNDIQAYDQKKYFKAANPTSGPANTVNDYDAPTTPGTGKDGQPITISKKYEELVGAGLDRSWRASYGQDGSTVIGMQAHSTTPLGVAIGTNSIVRKGAFGATAIGSGASVVANAEAAVAIGMGSEAQGNYAVAAGTAARAAESAVAVGYSATATNASVAVGQLAKATKVADIAVGQGAVASGEQGAIAMGLGTQAQGHSSIMIGGSEITEVAAQKVNYQKEKIDADGKTVIKSTKKTETIGGEQVERTIRSVEMENTMGTIQQAYGELTNGDILNTTRLDYSSATNRNGHGSISMGIHSLSTGDLGTAIGTGARVTKLGGVALGTGAISELQNGVAIGTGSRADSRSIGTRQTDISYDEEGHIVPFDSKKVAYTFYWAGGSNTSEGDVVSFGSPGAERQLKNVAAGRIADDSTDAINGSQLNSVTKRMSNGWSVEAEKDKTSSGVLKLNGAAATAGAEVHSNNGKTTTRENLGTATGKVDKIRLNDEVKIRVGDNLVLHQEDASRPVYEDPDDPTRQTGTRVTSKFTYSLNPELTGLKSAQFKNDAGDTTDINGAGVTVTPVTAGKQPVSLTTAGLNNGGNAISNVAGNLPSTKNNDATTGASNATTSQAAPTLGNAANQVNPTNAATVSDVLNAGWNLQGNNKAVDFVKPYDTVNFVNGDGTTATVESEDGKTSTVKYSVNLGDGLKKDDATNKITVSAADKSLTVGTDGVKVNPGDKSLKTTDAGLTVNTADKSLEVTDAGLKVKAGDKTLTTDEKGLKVNTGEIESVTTGANPGTVKVKDNDAGKIATVDSVVNAVNSAAWIATSEKTAAGELGATPTDQSVKAGDKVTFEADKNIKITQAGSKFTFATKDNVSFDTVQVGGSEGPKFAKAADGSIKVSDKDGTEPVKITNVKDGDISADSKDAINGSQFHKLANNTIQLKGQTGDNAATETKKQELNKKGGIAFTVKSSDGTLLEVSAAEDTITLTPKTATLTTGTDGVPTANTDGGKLVTADQLVNTLKSMGWKATAGQDDKGTVTDATVELIKAGETVTFKAGNNLAVKQVGKNFIYSLQKDLTDLTSAGFKNAAGDTTAINGDGVTITPVTNGKQPVSLTKDGLNNGGNPITNVGGNLDGAKTGTDVPTTNHAPINTTDATGPNYVNSNNAATVGDVLQAGWNLQGNNTAVDFVKPYDTVNFVDGDGTTVSVTNTDTKTSTVKYSINLGNGLEKDDTTKKVQVKPADKSLAVGADGVKVNTADTSLEVTDDGLKVKTDNKTITTGKDGLTVNTGTVNAVEQGDKKGTVEVPTADAGKIATVDTVAKAVNNAAFTLKASANGGTRNAGSGVTTDGESIKAGSTIEMIAGKNLDVKHDASGKITFATVENPSFNTIQVGGDQGPKLSKTDDGNIKVSDKDGTNPVNITNVKSNLPDTQNSDAPNTATNPSNATKSQAAPTLGTSANQVNPANAATVGDVLNAGWNLQGNGSAVDFVKPYDTVNFVNGVNTTAVVSTVDGKTSNVTYNVTGLPITYTDKDGNPVSKIGDNFYKVNDKGQPLDAKGNPSTKVNKDGKPVDDAGNVIDPINTTNNPVKTSLVNPAPEANKTGTTSPTTLDNVTSKLENYKADPVNGKEPAKNSLRDLTNTNVTDNTVATVGDIRNMGWIVSSDKTTGANGTTTATEYSEAVKNANEVRFVGEGSAIVSGKTDDKGVRTITVKVDSQTGLNKTVTPVNYTKADGTKVYPQEVDNGDGTKTVKFFENPDGTGKEIPSTEVITSVNGPKGTTTPATLSNVKSNLPDTKNSDTANTADAPSNATKSQAAPNTTNKDGDKYINPNNAATVSDVLNAGWNLQGNGTAVDFVKPYDTVNFVNGLNTTAVVSTVDGKTSNVTYNVTGLPVTYTTEDGTPVTKIGDKYYKVNDQGQPLDSTGAPVTKFNKDGKPLDANGQEVPDVNITDNPLKTSLVNPTPEANKTGTTSPTSLSNVKNNIPTVNDEDKTAHKADGTAIDGKNNTEAPITAGDAANLLKPTVNGVANPNFVGNNAATVSDVLNAGWNLQNNGTAKDFVKPYDTVNFVNGGNTTAVVTTNAAGTASDVTFNVTGLPVTYTTEDGAPVSKVGDKYYKVNDKGQPISDAGKPAVGKNNDGKLVDENNNVIEPIDTTKPLKTALVNPIPAGDKPNTTTATQLGNVTSGLDK
ncbi:ESPR-type extended signal peptide-containing protein, partial [Veillonella sp. oral taxon 780]|uniref:ESPR-type extended signal peptide-containing protein n=1 Tax=Veillonella sp. oral taxon 780 TaxID=671229 RepID=UPI00021A210D